MNDEIPESTGVPEVDRILSNKYRKSADTSPTFSKQVRDTSNWYQSTETRKTISPSKTQNQWLNAKMPSKQISVDDTSPVFSKQVRDTGNLALRKERSETIQKIPSQKAKSPWFNKAQREQDEANEEYADKVIASNEARSRIFELGKKVNAGTISDAERAELYKGIPNNRTFDEKLDDDDVIVETASAKAQTKSAPKRKSSTKRSSQPVYGTYLGRSELDGRTIVERADGKGGSYFVDASDDNILVTKDGIPLNETPSAKIKRLAKESQVEGAKGTITAKENDPDWLINKGFDAISDTASTLGKIAKHTIKSAKSGEKTAETQQTTTQPSSSTNPDAILAEAASTNPYGIYAKHEYNSATGRHELHFYKRDGKRLTHKDVEYLLTPTQIKALKQYAEYAYAGKVPSARKRTVLSSSSNPNTSIPASTGTTAGTPDNRKYTKWEVTQPNRTKAGLVGSAKIRTLTKANTATNLTGQPATTALAGKKDASGSIGGNSTRRDAFGSVTGQVTGFGTTKRDAQGSIMGTTNKNFVGVNNGNAPRLNAPRNPQGSITGASGNAIGYDAVKTINNPNRTRQATIGGLTQRRSVTNSVAQPISAAQGAVNLSHVVTPSAINRQTVAQEQAIQAQEQLQFNAGTRVATKSAIKPSRQKSPSRIVRKGASTGEINTTRPVTKAGIKPSRQKSPSKITRRPAQVTRSAINKPKSAHYSKIVQKAVKDAGLVEAQVGANTILIDEKELTKSGLKTKSRTKKPSAIKQRARNASPSQIKTPHVSLRYSKLVRRGA